MDERGDEVSRVDLVLAAVGNSPSKLASKMGGGLMRQHIEYWRKAGEIPVEHAPGAELATGVPCETIRPDIAWIRVPDPEWPHPGGRPCHDILGSARLREMRDAA